MPLDKENRFSTQMDLSFLNTFGVKAWADCLIIVRDEQALRDILKQWKGPFRVLGGGSNILITADIRETVLKNEIKGIEVVEQQGISGIIKIGGGENWHDFVQWCLDHDYGGVENLSLIPGTVGAAPIQNIGAYGVELKEVFHQLEAVRLSDGHRSIFSSSDCAFGYRDSVFKHRLKEQYLITYVYLKLTIGEHHIRTDYGAIRDILRMERIEQPTIQDVSRAVIQIRQQKLPDPSRLGNAGSFFKNPLIPSAHFEELHKRFPDVVAFPAENGKVKISAGWLIEQCGWKGKRIGAVGCYIHQSLVIVNHGGAAGMEIWEYALQVMDSVWKRFQIQLEPEVNIWS